MIAISAVVVLIIIETLYHIVIAIPRGSEPADERDTMIDLKAERNGGYAPGIGLFWLVGHIIASY